MCKTHPAILLAIAVLAALSGCLSVGGKPRGPVDAFLFTAGANPGLAQDAAGTLNMRSDPLEISVVVPPGTDRRRLVATLTLNAEATITVISTGNRMVQENGATANDFSSPVLYSIEVAKEKKPWRYKVTVREAETNPRLAQLGFPEGSTLSPAFSPQVRSYTVVVPFATRQLRISARAESPYLKSITFDGASAAGSSAAGNVDFASGQERSVVIETLAEDGVTRERYTLTVRRGEPDRNSLLAALEATEGTLAPAFSPQRTEYSLQVPFAATRIGLRARSQSGLAALALSTIAAAGDAQERAGLQTRGSLTDPGGASVEFTGVDWLPLIVTATAQDGSRREYLIEVARAEPDHNNALASLTVAGAALSPVFAPGSLSYVVRVPFATRQVSVSAKPQSTLARAVLEPGAASQGTPAAQGDLASPEGALVAFPAGERLSLAVAVTAQDGRILRYLLDIRRQPPDRNADLAAIAPAAGSLAPAFSPKIVSYALRLPPAVETATLTLTAASRTATVRAEPPASLAGTSLTVPVAPGQSVVVSILVTAEDGTQKLYRVNVTREGPPPASGQEGNARLALLQLGGAPLTPPFDPAVTAYEVKIPASAGSLLLVARAESPTASLTMDGQPLPAGGRLIALGAGASFTLAVEVKAENGTIARYTLRLLRETSALPVAGDLLVAAKLQLGGREAAALAERRETVGAQALLTVRGYRTGQVLAQVPAAVSAKVQGSGIAITLEQRVGNLGAAAGRLVEVETAIPTSGGRYLCYTEALPLGEEARLEIPFLLLADNPRVAWPAVGSPVAVGGYRSHLPPGKARGSREDLEKNEKGESGVSVEIADPNTGAVLSRETGWIRPGPGRLFSFGRPLQLPEGAQVAYRLSAKARGGKTRLASGTAQVWTTALAYEGGYAPVLLLVDDELQEGTP